MSTAGLLCSSTTGNYVHQCSSNNRMTVVEEIADRMLTSSSSRKFFPVSFLYALYSGKCLQQYHMSICTSR